MSLKFYAAIVTATITAIFVFDVLWAFTRITIENTVAMSMFASLAAGIAFMLFAYHEENDLEDEGSSYFIDTGGLNVMVMKSRGNR